MKTVQIYNALTQTLPGVITKTYRNLPFATGNIVPTTADLQAGAEDVLQDLYNESGAAALIAGDALDVPIITVGMSQDRAPVFMFAAGYNVTFQDSRAQSFNARVAAQAQRKQVVAARAIAQAAHKWIAVGSPAVNQTGFFNNPLVPTRASGFDPSATDVTAVTFRSFLIDAVWHSYTERTGYTRFPAAILLSPNLFKMGTELLMPDSAISVLQSVKDSIMSGDLGGVTPQTLSIGQVPEASAAWQEANGVKPVGTGTDRIVVYTNESDIMNAQMETLQQIPMEWMGSETGRKTFGNFECWTPTMIEQPYLMEYYDLPAAA